MSREAPAQIGILSSDRKTRIDLRSLVNSAGVGSVLVEAEDCPTSPDDISLVLWRQASPDVILVASSDPREIVATVATLHQALPRAWLFAVSNISETQVVISTVRAGACEFLQTPVSLKSFREAMHRLQQEKQRDTRTKPYGKVYGITSAKGGLGTTTIAVNLAVATSALSQRNVAIIDLGYPLGDAGALLDVRPPFTVLDAFNISSRLDSVLLESSMIQKHGVSLLAGRTEVSAKDWPSQESFQKTMTVVAETFTHAFVDIPCSINLDHLGTLVKLCDSLMVVVTPEIVPLWRTHRFLSFMKRWDAMNKMRLVVNKFDSRGEITLREIERSLELEVYWTIPDDYGQVVGALNSGKPLVKVAGSSLAVNFNGLARELSGVVAEKKKPGLLASLWGKSAAQKENSGRPRSQMFNLLRDSRS